MKIRIGFSTKAAFEMVRKWEYLLENPFKEIKQIKIKGKNYPLFLSEGEAKILWFLTQWVKQSKYLIIGYLPASLSNQRIKDFINFFNEEKQISKKSPVIILGYQSDQTDWCTNLLSNKQWQVISSWTGKINSIE